MAQHDGVGSVHESGAERVCDARRDVGADDPIRHWRRRLGHRYPAIVLHSLFQAAPADAGALSSLFLPDHPGQKSIAFGDDRLVYDAARFVVAAVDLPVTGVVLDATPEKPYLCVMLEIDVPELASLLLDTETPAHADAAGGRGLFLGEATAPFVDAVWRLMRLLDAPGDIRALAPLAEREVLYRLLQSNAGARLRDVVAGNGPARRIARSIAW